MVKGGDRPMKNLKIKILEYDTPQKANEELSEYINYLNDNDIEIAELTSHVNADTEGNYCYTFIFKFKGGEKIC